MFNATTPSAAAGSGRSGSSNHVWLIFVLVVLWTGFPPVFAAIASTLYIPLTLAAFGMIVRGGAFALLLLRRRYIWASKRTGGACRTMFTGRRMTADHPTGVKRRD